MKNVKQITFDEALERTRAGEIVYAIDTKKNLPRLKQFKMLSIGEVVINADNYIYQIWEED